MRISIASPWLVGFVTSLTSACSSAGSHGSDDFGAGDELGTVAQAVLPAPQASRFDTPRRDSSGAVAQGGGEIFVGASIDDPTQNGFAVIRFNPQGQVVWRLHLQSFGGPGTYGSVTTLAVSNTCDCRGPEQPDDHRRATPRDATLDGQLSQRNRICTRALHG